MVSSLVRTEEIKGTEETRWDFVGKATTGKPNLLKGPKVEDVAAVSRQPGEPLVIEEITVAPPGAYEVRIRIICTSLCYSDITFWKLKVPPACFPRILGHEAIGVVESVGENVEEVKEGDTVIPTFMADCGDCVDCRSKKSNLCSKLPFALKPWMPRNDTTRFTDLNGEPLYHFLFVSSFSEYTVLDVAHVVKIDPAIPPNRACLLSCGVSTGQRFGVTEFVDSSSCGDKSVSQVINEMTGGGADYCFECVGLSSLVEEAYASCRKGWGKTIVLGVDRPGAQLNFSSFEVLHTGKTITGSLFGGIKAKSDIPILLKRYVDKELHLDEFVTHEVKFEDINKAFNLLIEGKCIRCVIWMDK
ncbi:hypothetical protein SLEP1_g54355 [Rubroshorea leprosula]|uniref:alcohol dehydrogenase n=1 Tax=Rubroshorea leprosula TaxID=152421 RepID=A0AAV5MFS4_9ROSI|nr:hypothetical protein SLEP1_g54355 [Rubroshorea leprosula]